MTDLSDFAIGILKVQCAETDAKQTAPQSLYRVLLKFLFHLLGQSLAS